MQQKLTNKAKKKLCTCVLLSDALPAWLSSPFSPSSSSSVTVPPLIGCRSLSFLEDEPYKREISFWRKNILLGILSLSVLCRSYSFFSTFYGTRRFITAFKRACHLSPSSASSIQSIPPHPSSSRSILILSSLLYLGLPSGHLPSGFHTKTLYTPLLSPIQATWPAISFFSFYYLNNIGWGVQIMKLLIM